MPNIDDIKKETESGKKEVESYISDVEGKNDSNLPKDDKSIKKIMEGNGATLEEFRLSSFKESKGIAKDEEIGEDLEEEYKNYELPLDERRRLCEESANKMYDVYFDRQRKLNNLLGNKAEQEKALENGEEPKLGKVDENIKLINEEIEKRDNEIKECEAKIEELKKAGKVDKEKEDSEYVNQGEIDEIQSRIDELTKEKEDITSILEKAKDLKQSLIHAMGLQKQMRENIEGNLRDVYGEDVANPVIEQQKQREESSKNEKESNNKDDVEKPIADDNNKEVENEDKAQDEQEQQEKQNNQQPQQQYYQQPIMNPGFYQGQPQQAQFNNGGVAGPVASAVAANAIANDDKAKYQENAVADSTVSIEEETGPAANLLSMLGTNENGATNKREASEILDKFMSKELTNDDRMLIIRNPEAYKVLKDSIAELNNIEDGKGFKFIQKFQSWRINNKLNKFIDKTMSDEINNKISQFDNAAKNSEEAKIYSKEELSKELGEEFALDLGKNPIEEIKRLKESEPEKFDKLSKQINEYRRNYSAKLKDLEEKKKDPNLTQEERDSYAKQIDTLTDMRLNFDTRVLNPYTKVNFKDDVEKVVSGKEERRALNEAKNTDDKSKENQKEERQVQEQDKEKDNFIRNISDTTNTSKTYSGMTREELEKMAGINQTNDQKEEKKKDENSKEI